MKDAIASALTLVVFILVIIGVIWLATAPFKLPIPRLSEGLPITFSYPPVLGVLLLLATRAISGNDFAAGVKGNKQIQPYGIVILFMSLAFICVSLDATGVFSWLALKLTTVTKGDGRLLFLAYFALSSAITLVTSNDIVIMTLTPIICYFAQATGADPLPYLITEFTAANVWSMALFVGNPTNIIVAEAYGMTFLGYSKWMLLPTIASGVATLGVLYAMFRSRLPGRLELPRVEPSLMLADRLGAVLGSCTVLGCLGLLAAAPSLGWSLWPITLAFAGLQASYNFVAYVLIRHVRIGARRTGSFGIELVQMPQVGHVQVPQVGRPQGMQRLPTDERGAEAADHHGAGCSKPAGACARNGNGHAVQHLDEPHIPAFGSNGTQQKASQGDNHKDVDSNGWGPVEPVGNGDLSLEVRDETLEPAGKQLSGTWAVAGGSSPTEHVGPAGSFSGSTGRDGPRPCQVEDDDSPLHPHPPPSFLGILKALPWEIVPFVLSMFVLVEALAVTGWVDEIAKALAAASGNLAAAVASAGAASIVLANVLNNQPMTILLTRVYLSPKFAAATGKHRQLAALFALVVGSNLGANFTLIGALAGIMWASILGKKGIQVSYLRFVQLAAPVGLAAAVAALGVLYIEFLLFP